MVKSQILGKKILIALKKALSGGACFGLLVSLIWR
jgi:hypothetical protein